MANKFERFGLEHGYKQPILVLGDMQFINLLHDADLYSLGYILPVDEYDLITKPILIFLYKDQDLGLQSFKNFIRWIDLADGDTNIMSVEFLVEKDKYTLSISQDMEKLIDIYIPEYFQRWTMPITTIGTYYKTFNITSDMFFRFRDLAQRRNYYILGGTEKYQFKGKIDISNCQFYDYESVPKNTASFRFKCNDKSKIIKKPPPVNKKEVLQLRNEKMKYFFPVTLEKIAKPIYNKYFNDTFTESEVFQAICNIVLFERIDSNPEIQKEIIKDGLVDKTGILKYIIDTPEMLSSYYPENNLFTKELILQQIELDHKDLLNYQKTEEN